MGRIYFVSCTNSRSLPSSTLVPLIGPYPETDEPRGGDITGVRPESEQEDSFCQSKECAKKTAPVQCDLSDNGLGRYGRA